MKQLLTNHWPKLLLVAVLGVALLIPVLAPTMAEAATFPGRANISGFTSNAGLRGGDLQSFAATVIRWLLGIIGVILVGLIVYGGVTYATAAGNEDRAEQGKNILTYAIIGVVIVVIAWLLTDYILSALFDNSPA